MIQTRLLTGEACSTGENNGGETRRNGEHADVGLLHFGQLLEMLPPSPTLGTRWRPLRSRCLQGAWPLLTLSRFSCQGADSSRSRQGSAGLSLSQSVHQRLDVAPWEPPVSAEGDDVGDLALLGPPGTRLGR